MLTGKGHTAKKTIKIKTIQCDYFPNQMIF